MLRTADRDKTRLLSSGDPVPVEWVNAEGRSDIFLTCEHAGRAVPLALGDQLALQVLEAAAADLADEAGDRRRADAGLGCEFLDAFETREGIVGEDRIGDLALAGRQLLGGRTDARADGR